MPLTTANTFEYWGKDAPKCPYCDREICIQENEMWHLYEEEDHDIECPHCAREIRVRSQATWTFSTDEQEELEDEATEQPGGDRE